MSHQPCAAALPRPVRRHRRRQEQPSKGGSSAFALEQIELAPNARRDISTEGIDRLAAMLAAHRTARPLHRPPTLAHRTGDPLRRPTAATGRHAAATSSRQRGLRGPRTGQSLIVLLLDHSPAPDEITAHPSPGNNAREDLCARRPTRPVPRLLGGPRRARRGGAHRRRVRRPRDRRPQGAQPATAAHAARADPHPRRRAARRRPAVGHDGKPARRTCTRSPPT